jgi:hypothetical protein
MPPANQSSNRMTPEKLAEYKELLPLGRFCGVGGSALKLLLDEIEACWAERSSPETGAPLTLGKLVLDTARGDVKERTLSPSEAESFHKALASSPRRTASPIAQFILDRVTEVNVGIFLTGAIDHIEKGGNVASGEVELRDGTLVELRMSRLPVKTSVPPEDPHADRPQEFA